MKELYKNEWLSLKETDDGYVYSHEEKCNGQIVAILVFLENEIEEIEQILGRFEIVPCHNDGCTLVSITGGVENGEIKKTAILELEEEAGILAKEDDLISLGTVRPSKSTDSIVYLFGVNGDNKISVTPRGDGSEGEKHAYCKWITPVMVAKSKDPLLSTMLLRYLLRKNKKFV